MNREEFEKYKGMVWGVLKNEYPEVAKMVKKMVGDEECLHSNNQGEWVEALPLWCPDRAYFPTEAQIDAYYRQEQSDDVLLPVEVDKVGHLCVKGGYVAKLGGGVGHNNKCLTIVSFVYEVWRVQMDYPFPIAWRRKDGVLHDVYHKDRILTLPKFARCRRSEG